MLLSGDNSVALVLDQLFMTNIISNINQQYKPLLVKKNYIPSIPSMKLNEIIYVNIMKT